MPYLDDNGTSATNNPFITLIYELSAVLGPSSGLDSADVNPHHIRRLMEDYTSKTEEWALYALADVNKTYTRNLIDEGNGKRDRAAGMVLMRDTSCLILVWSPEKGSAIHDHADAHCVMKILQGSLQETLYTWPDQAKINAGQVSPPEIKKVSIYGENEVAYMSDMLGLHKISNPDPDNVAVSLHLYTPPNAANYGFSVFDEETGKAMHIKQPHFYSVRGVRC